MLTQTIPEYGQNTLNFRVSIDTTLKFLQAL